MSRSDADTWDAATGVGVTATMVAAARALASREPDPLICDPFAEPLVRAVGVDFFVRMLDDGIPSDVDETAGGAARMMTDIMAVRTRFFDDFFTSVVAAGVRQAVILAAGLDSRSYRLPWPDGTVVYEIDQPKVVEFKASTLAATGAAPTAELRTVAVDLRDDWPAALREAGFDDTAPTAWSAEGLLMYLPPDAQDRLFDNITALSAAGSRLATEYHSDAGAGISERTQAMRTEWQKHGFDLDLADLFYTGERHAVVDYLRDHGWQVDARLRPEVFADYGRAFPDTGELTSMRDSLAVLATRK